MSWWNFGGLNPKLKDFIEKHPEKTVIGMAWAFYWRFFVLVIVLEVVLAFIFFVLAASLGA